mmetsp:Transcript_57046/g.102565  ORF Transcript_57046/g.102565 Transcript_57046/m.102565 type:complete len:204 (+) Transcript_57046:62-673(+)
MHARPSLKPAIESSGHRGTARRRGQPQRSQWPPKDDPVEASRWIPDSLQGGLQIWQRFCDGLLGFILSRGLLMLDSRQGHLQPRSECFRPGITPCIPSPLLLCPRDAVLFHRDAAGSHAVASRGAIHHGQTLKFMDDVLQPQVCRGVGLLPEGHGTPPTNQACNLAVLGTPQAATDCSDAGTDPVDQHVLREAVDGSPRCGGS